MITRRLVVMSTIAILAPAAFGETATTQRAGPTTEPSPKTSFVVSLGQLAEWVTQPESIGGHPVNWVPSLTNRGRGRNGLLLSLLVPSELGQTSQARPSFWFHLSRPTTLPIIATITQGHDPMPLKTWRIPGGAMGFHELSMMADESALKVGPKYELVVAVCEDPQHRSKDIIAMGYLHRVNVNERWAMETDAADIETKVKRCIRAKLFYDAIAAAVSGIENTDELRSSRPRLLESFHLSESAGAIDRR